jgi:hypothetical protein
MANAAPISTARRNEITSAIALATRLLWVFGVIAVGGIALFRPGIYAPGAVLFAAGIGSYAVLLLSWHYYRPKASIYAWLLFSIAIAISLFVGLVLPAVRDGVLHPLGALSAVMGCLGLGTTVPLVISAPRLRNWANE